MPILHRDYETRSTLDLPEVGAWRYSRHAGTEVRCCAYAVDGEPVKLWVPGDPAPEEFIEAANNPDWLVSAFNDQFERLIEAHIMAPRHGWPIIPIERHRCTQATALSLSLPAKLERVAEVLGLANQKDMAGQRLMRQMSKPRKTREGEDPAGIYWDDDPERLALLYKYCKQDVEVERELDQRIGHLTPAEQTHWQLDSVINDRGIALDKGLIDAAIQICETADREINAELREITDGVVETINKIAELKAWLAENGCEVPNIRDKTLARVLTRKNLTPKAKRATELRLDGAHAAVNKFATMANWLGAGDRVHGVYRYHGTSTGRWTSLGIQLQNLKRPEVADLGAAIEDVRAGDYHRLRAKYPRPLSVVGDIARATIIARPGHRLLIGDFSGIESRVLAQVSGQQSKLDQWAKFDATGNPEDEPYFILGRNNFGFAPEEARGKGKTGDLAFGYMGSIGAFRVLAPDDPATDEEVKRRREAWRRAHPQVVQFWRSIERAAIRAMQHPGQDIGYRDVVFTYAGDFLKLRLPSGRCLSYPFPRLHTNDRGNLVVIYKDSTAGKWVDCHFGRGAYAGIWTENVVSAVARDLFAQAMQRLESAGYPVVLHVHDEICCEVRNDFGSLEEFRQIITAVPDWAKGLPIASKVRESDCFAKITKPVATILIEPNTSRASLLLSSPPHGSGASDARKSSNARHPHGDPGPKQGTPLNTWTYLHLDRSNYLRVDKHVAPNGARHFYQYHWSGNRWVFGVKGTYAEKKIPYRLPELKAALQTDPDVEIQIAEGEKDADSLARLGFVATTNSGGAKGWTDDLTAWMRILGVQRAAIHEDNDEAGRARTSRLTAALSFIKLRIVCYPDVPEGEDITYWLEHGHGRADLDARIAAATSAVADGFVFTRASDIIPRPMDWLWQGHLLRGSQELLTGIPGGGKSQIHCALVAYVTTGGVWPDGANGIPAGNAIMLTAEDCLDQTMVPRLIAAGADRNRVFLLKKIRKDNKERMFLLGEDLEQLERMIAKVGDIRLITIDPITAYMGGKVDSHRATDVRGQLGPLADLAERMDVALSAITHPPKHSSQRAIDHFIGSQAFIAAARIGHMAIEEMEEDENGNRIATGRSLFTNPKNNVSRKMPTIAYRVAEKPLDGGIYAPFVVWEEVVDITADQAVAAATPSKKDLQSNAVTFLQDVLTNGPVETKIILKRGEVRGFSEDQLKRAKKKMGVVGYRKGGLADSGTWFWALPQHVPPGVA